MVLHCIVLTAAIVCISYAQFGVIVGSVTDGQSGEPVIGASIRLSGLPQGAVTRRDGSFHISRVPSGTVRLLVSAVGYHPAEYTLIVPSGDTARIRIVLQSQAITSAAVVVSAARRVQSVQEVSTSVSLVDAQSIAERAMTRLDEVLRYVPGVVVTGSQVSIRGSSGFAYGLGSRVLLLIDNFPALSADNGDMSFDALPIADVERIEIVKGAGSALYGTSALGGVINVITRDASAAPELRVRAIGGLWTLPRFETWRYRNDPPRLGAFDASTSATVGPAQFLAAGGYRRDESYRDYNDSRRWYLFTKAAVDLNASADLRIVAQYAADNRANWLNWRDLRYATLPPATTDTTDRVDSRKVLLGLEQRTVWSSQFFTTLRGSLYNTWYTNSIPRDSAGHVSADATQYNAELQASYQASDQLNLTAGINAVLNAVESPYTQGRRLQTIVSSYVQAEWRLGERITTTLGARADNVSTEREVSGMQLSPKLGVTYRLAEQTTLRASVGRAFRAATITERYAALRFAGFTVGINPNLRSEVGWSAEIGMLHTTSIAGREWTIDGAAFVARMDDLIEPQFVVDTTAEIRFINITRALLPGIELTVRGWLLQDIVGIESGATLMAPRDLVENATLRFRHNVQWNTRLLVQLAPSLRFHADYRFLSRVERIDDRIVQLGLVPNGDARVPIHILDIRLLWDVPVAVPLRLALNVRNALDYYYTEYIGNLGPTRQLSLQAEWTVR
ncbi:MAG: TonB-dependent receptor [Bacteroidota bacterium]|nr:TonB-dependent receptor [Candidatus Kapabacteria bacterium]MCS7302727.1 TonB-dependent receptor [Candidatus Kapabacteria bacterium]MDW8272386.1 TonB-dependent receptor [Bacteroidota bacterium]